MEGKSSISEEAPQLEYSKATKRVLSSQNVTKVAASNSNPTAISNHSQRHSETPTVSNHSTEPSKKSKFTSKCTEKTPSQRKSTGFNNGLTPVKSSAPKTSHLVSRSEKDHQVSERRSLFSQKISSQESPRKTVRNRIENNNSYFSSPLKTASFKSEPNLIERNERPRSSFESCIQRPNIFEHGNNANRKSIRIITPDQLKASELGTPHFIGELPNPKIMKQEELRTFAINHSPSKVEIYEVCLQNIPQEYSEFIVRELLRGFHLVAVIIDSNNITGECKGTGKIIMRTNYEQDVQALVVKLRKFGISAHVDMTSKGRRNNFSEFFSENWQLRKEQPQPSPSRAREAKLKSLQSSIFT